MKCSGNWLLIEKLFRVVERHKPRERREMKQAIIDLAAAVNKLADAVEKITEKGGKEISPLIPPTKKGSQKESFLSSACARACEGLPPHFTKSEKSRKYFATEPLKS